jgi:hypothetical protein
MTMTLLSSHRASSTTQSSAARTDDERLREWFADWREERLRTIFSQHLRHGDEARIAGILSVRPESISRQLSHGPNHERLSDAFASLAQHFLTMDLGANHKVVNEIRELRHLGFSISRIRLVLDVSQESGTAEWSYVR